MKFSVGDRVLLKRTGEEGFIVSFISKQLMEVDVAGIRFPVYADEVDHPYLKWFTDPGVRKIAKPVPVEPPAPEKHPPRRLPQGIYLSFLPQFDPSADDDIITGFRIHLINETPDAVRFRYQMREVSGALVFTHQAELHPFGNVYLHPVSLELMNAQPRMQWALGAAATPGLPFDGVLRIRPAQLVRYIRDTLEGSQPAFSVMLRSDVELQGSRGQQRLPVLQPGSGRENGGYVLHTAADSVLDLHIDPRNAAFSGLDAGALLEYQLRLFDKKLSAAIAAGLHEMIVIHGVGNGTLRDALHQRLTEIAEVSNFRNDWSPQYGWGATRLSF